MEGRQAVVIGGGGVALRKCRALLDAGARVTVVSPDLHPELIALRDRGEIVHHRRLYATGDLAGALLAYAATSDPGVNRAVAREAADLGIPVNIADAPESGSFISPSRISRGDLIITVSTGGRTPVLARRIREELERQFGPEYAPAVQLLGAVREKLLTEKGDRAYNKQLLNRLAEWDIPRMFRDGRTAELNDLLLQLLGPGYTLSGLMAGTKDPA
jgi:precorrin-2 dehydrogenase/sirohydrochlorin ferrochelatase